MAMRILCARSGCGEYCTSSGKASIPSSEGSVSTTQQTVDTDVFVTCGAGMSSHGDNSESNGSFCLLLLHNRFATKTLPYRLSLPPTRFETFEVAFNGKVDCDFQ